MKTRDSILLTYFVDAGALRFLRNRGKRFGNFVLSEVRNRLPYVIPDGKRSDHHESQVLEVGASRFAMDSGSLCSAPE